VQGSHNSALIAKSKIYILHTYQVDAAMPRLPTLALMCEMKAICQGPKILALLSSGLCRRLEFLRKSRSETRLNTAEPFSVDSSKAALARRKISCKQGTAGFTSQPTSAASCLAELQPCFKSRQNSQSDVLQEIESDGSQVWLCTLGQWSAWQPCQTVPHQADAREEKRHHSELLKPARSMRISMPNLVTGRKQVGR